MKRLICLLLVLAVLTVPVLGAEFGTIYDLWNAWSTEGTTPDWVCGVSSTDGSVDHLTVIVSSAEAEAQLRAMVEDASTLTVIVSETAYSTNALQKIQKEIVAEYMQGDNSPVAGVGVGWTTVDGEVTGFGESGRESRVVVEVLDAYAQTVGAEIKARYADAVYVETVGGYAVAETAAEEAEPVSILPVLLTAGILVIVTAAVIVIRRKNHVNQ